MAKKKKGLSGMSLFRRKASKLMSAKKAGKSSYKAPKKRTGSNVAAKKTIAGRKASKGGAGSSFKTKAKQKMLNIKGKSKAVVRNTKAGKYKMTAAHKKAISDALSKRSGGVKKKISSLFSRKK